MTNDPYKIIVIGGGAAGMVAAIMAARRLGETGGQGGRGGSGGSGILILEHMARVGRKLLATGNGRCNLTNTNVDLVHFHGNHPKFVQGALRQFDVTHTLKFFEELGVAPRVEAEGQVFPASGQASSVLDVLRYELEERGVETVLDARVTEIEPVGNISRDKNAPGKNTTPGGGLRCRTTDGRVFEAGRVILATGGKSAPNLGSNGGGFKIAEKLGHHIVEPHPALVQLRLGEEPGKSFLKQLQGVRIDAALRLEITTGSVAADSGGAGFVAASPQPGAGAGPATEEAVAAGELLFTEYGLSGLPAMQLSRGVSAVARALALGETAAWLHVDLFPDTPVPDLARLIESRIAHNPRKPLDISFVGLLHKRLIGVVLAHSGFCEQHVACGALDNAQVRALAARLKDWRLRCTGTQSWMTSQVTAGGVDVREVDRRTMESKVVQGLYFAGEVLDIDADCGGYNLQWAWSSGAVAGIHASGSFP